MARILVIDDEANIRMMIGMALRKDGHTVGQAADGPDGLRCFDDGRGWDLVLLDQRMPGMEGLEVMRQMRLRDPAARVVIITAFGTVDLAVEAMKAGASDFLRKPFTLEVLRGTVQSALGTRRDRAVEEEGTIFAFTTLNGFTIESHREAGKREGGITTYRFGVRSPSGEARTCTVILPAYVMELVKAHAGLEEPPGGDLFWQGFCEEALANYVWQNAQMPPEEGLRVDEYSTTLRRWTDAVLFREPLGDSNAL